MNIEHLLRRISVVPARLFCVSVSALASALRWLRPYSTSIALLIVLLLAGCTPLVSAPMPYVDLSVRTPLPAVAPGEVAHLRVGIAAIVSPQGTMESYAHLADFLEEKLERPVDLVQRRTYAELNDLIAGNQLDLAFICTNAYVVGSEKSGMELLLVPEIDGESVYHSQLIVPAASTALSMADLEGKVFAFTDPMSFTGHIYPKYELQQMGVTAEQFFQRTFFTYSHDRAIEAVADGVADGAAVDSLVLTFALERDPSLQARIRIIHTSEPFGIPPVVTPPGLPPRQKAQIRELLLAMDQDPAGLAVLKELGFDRFVVTDDAAYNGVRELVHATGAAP